jgi:hypothetical protein
MAWCAAATRSAPSIGVAAACHASGGSVVVTVLLVVQLSSEAAVAERITECSIVAE